MKKNFLRVSLVILFLFMFSCILVQNNKIENMRNDYQVLENEYSFVENYYKNKLNEVE